MRKQVTVQFRAISQWRLYPQAASPYVQLLKSDITPDAGHHPGLTYLPFILTGDPYYLEALQLSTTWCIGSAPAS